MIPDDATPRRGGGEHPKGGGAEAPEPALVGAVLRAIAAMARISKRQQAEVGAALLRAGLVLDPAQLRAVLRHLGEAASIQDVIPLDDGGVLLSVTSAGMERALR